MLKPEKYEELSRKSALVRDGYTLADNGFYKLNGTVDAGALRAFFAGNDFNALAFTDSRSRYQSTTWAACGRIFALPGRPGCGCCTSAHRPSRQKRCTRR